MSSVKVKVNYMVVEGDAASLAATGAAIRQLIDVLFGGGSPAEVPPDSPPETGEEATDGQ